MPIRSNSTQELGRTGPVTVVGGGPVGLTLAALLGQQDIPVRVFEAEADLPIDWRGSTTQPPTVELLERIGLADEMLKGGLQSPRIRFGDREFSKAAVFDMSVLAEDTAYPYRLQYEHYKLVRLLHERIERLPSVEINMGTKALSVELRDGGATVTIESGGSTERIPASILVGADGSHSIVRQAIGGTFDGVTYDDRNLVIGTDFRFEEVMPALENVNYLSGPTGRTGLIRTPDVWRIGFAVGNGLGDHEILEADAIQERLRKLTGIDTKFTIHQRQLYSIHRRVASHFSRGRALLVGDAAHINHPSGGMGLNSGIHDAFDAATSIGDVWQGKGEESFESYSERRRSIWLSDVGAASHRNNLLTASRESKVRRQKLEDLAAIAEDRSKSREWLLQVSMIASVRRQGLLENP